MVWFGGQNGLCAMVLGFCGEVPWNYLETPTKCARNIDTWSEAVWGDSKRNLGMQISTSKSTGSGASPLEPAKQTPKKNLMEHPNRRVVDDLRSETGRLALVLLPLGSVRGGEWELGSSGTLSGAGVFASPHIGCLTQGLVLEGTSTFSGIEEISPYGASTFWHSAKNTKLAA